MLRRLCALRVMRLSGGGTSPSSAPLLPVSCLSAMVISEDLGRIVIFTFVAITKFCQLGELSVLSMFKEGVYVFKHMSAVKVSFIKPVC